METIDIIMLVAICLTILLTAFLAALAKAYSEKDDYDRNN